MPVAPISEWITAIAAGGLTFSDLDEGAANQKPYQASDGSRAILFRPDGLAGTTLRVRLKYPIGDDPPEQPLRIRIFGRASEDQPWAPVRNAVGDISVHVRRNDADDVFDGTGFQLTTPDNHEHSWDCDGNKMFLILVEVPYDTPSAADAELQAKIV